MVALTDRTQNRLTLQNAVIGPDTLAIRSLDWDRDRFDIEFGLNNGTTYNSFLIRGEKTALIDTSHRKFQDLYLGNLTQRLDPSQLDYLIISHTEPDHSGLVKDVLELAPQVVVVGSKVALQFLDDLVHQPFERLVVKNGDRLDLGAGHELEFLMAPNLHWPDTIFTYDRGTGILYTCDAFGMHYCNDDLLDEDVAAIEADFRYYYDCLMGPNARSVLSAMKRMAELPRIDTIATGHGPLLHHHIPQLTGWYRQWSQAQTKGEKSVAVFYLPEYGHAKALALAIAEGIEKTGVVVDLVDLATVDPSEVREITAHAAGLVIGMPSASSATVLSTILAACHSKQAIGLFESGGEEDELVYPLRNQFQAQGLVEAFAPILLKEAPRSATFQLCEEAGTDLGQWLTRDRTVQMMKSLDTDLDKALGRLSGGLYIITATRGNLSSAMVASWVAQASFEPVGLSVAVAKDRAIESLMQVGDHFVLNVLAEDNYQGLMRHFLKRFPPGADRFAGVKTQLSDNGSPILTEALAYLECTVVSRLETPDHWVVYSSVQNGRVSQPDSLTAVHHRKVGNHY